MVRKNTEYRTSYKKGNARKLRQTWEGNAGYCLLRRHSEHVHTPLNWDEEWSDCESTPRGVPVHVYKHEKYNDLYNKRKQDQLAERMARMQLDSRLKRDEDDLKNGPISPGSPAVGTPTTEHEGRKRTRSCSACAMHGTTGTAEEGTGYEKDITITPTRRRTYRKPIPKPRPMSAPLGRPVKKEKMKLWQHGSPFVPYGFKDKERETGRKRTHNIRAQAEVYPAALRAYHRRKLEVERRQEAAKDAPYRERRHRALFNDTFRRNATTWDTQYRDSYVGYDKNLYKHNIAQRYDPLLAWQAYVVP